MLPLHRQLPPHPVSYTHLDVYKRQDLVSGRYVIDAKSIMGISSLDLSKPIELNVHAEGNVTDDILSALEPYIIK